jgi:hypothetical protein
LQTKFQPVKEHQLMRANWDVGASLGGDGTVEPDSERDHLATLADDVLGSAQ